MEGSTDEVMDERGQTVSLPKLLINGGLNSEIVTQKVLITGKEVDALLSILTTPSKDLISSQGGCFTPHHAIIIADKNKTSYIELCFHCLSFKTSDNLSNSFSLHKNNWARLEYYFRAKGLTYEMPND